MGKTPDEIARGRDEGVPEEPGLLGEKAFRSADPEDPETLRADIVRTRAEMGETIDAIQARLNPDTLKEQATAAIRGATVGRVESGVSNAVERAEEAVNSASETFSEASSSLMETVRANPIPSAIAGAGLGWLLMNRGSGEESEHYDSWDEYERSVSNDYYLEGASGRIDDLQRGIRATGTYAQERAGENMNDAGRKAGQTNPGLMDTIKANPIPAAMAGLGLGWLFMNRSSSQPRRVYPTMGGGYPYGRREYGYGYGYGPEDRGPIDEARSRVGETAGRAQDTIGRVAGQAQSTVGQVAEQAQSTVSQAGEAVGDVAGQAQAVAGRVVDQAQETAEQIAGGTRYQARRVESGFQDMLRTNPLGVAGAALAVGALAGLLLPETPQENQFMGEAKESFMRQARTTAEETMEKVQRVTEQAQDTVQREAKQQGLTG